MLARRALLLLLPLVFSGACHGSPPTLDQACADRAAASCAMYASCLPMNFQQSFGDIDPCQSRLLLDCSNETLIIGESFTGARVEDCAREISATDCDAFVFPHQAGPLCAKMATNPAGHT